MEVDIKGICIEKLGKNRGKNGLTLHCFQLNVIQDVYFVGFTTTYAISTYHH
jgi:hypothetical protein